MSLESLRQRKRKLVRARERIQSVLDRTQEQIAAILEGSIEGSYQSYYGGGCRVERVHVNA